MPSDGCRLDRRRGRRVFRNGTIPTDGTDPVSAAQPLELDPGNLAEWNVGVALGQSADDLRDEDLTAFGPRCDARGEDDGSAEERVRLADHLTGVKADADTDAFLARLVVGGERLLDRDRALKRT